MDERIIQDWLAESTALSPGEVSSFASSLKHNDDLIRALFLIFDEHIKFHNLLEPISKQLFNFYRSKEFELRLFTLQFIPNLIYIYLNSVARGLKKSYHYVETLLIGVYNLEVVDDAGQPAVISFRLPSLAQASIYHEPMSLAHVSLTENALRRLEECNTKLINWGPHPQVETLNAQNRLQTLTKLLFVYNRHIGSLNRLSLKYLCRISSRLASQGFREFVTQQASPKAEGSKIEKLTRIPVSSQLFLELLCGLYYALYNGWGRLAMQAVDDIYNRSCYECYANVIAVANAIKNSSNITSSDPESEGPMGISVALSPATTAVTTTSSTTVSTVNKFMITNASFRTKKLPDDIPIILKEESVGGGGGGGDVSKPLTSITEEKEVGFSARGSSLRSKDAVAKNLQKLGIGKKSKDKDGKSVSKTSNSTLLQLSGLKEKVSSKSGIGQNVDLATAEVNGPSSGRTKALENGQIGETTSGSEGVLSPERVGTKLNFDGQTGSTSDTLNPISSNENVTGLFGSSSKNVEEKSFGRISSV